MKVQNRRKGKVRSHPEQMNGHAPTKALPVDADVQVQAIAGDVRQVPRSGTNQGRRALADMVHRSLDRVRRNIRERAGRER